MTFKTSELNPETLTEKKEPTRSAIGALKRLLGRFLVVTGQVNEGLGVANDRHAVNHSTDTAGPGM